MYVTHRLDVSRRILGYCLGIPVCVNESESTLGIAEILANCLKLLAPGSSSRNSVAMSDSPSRRDVIMPRSIQRPLTPVSTVNSG
jgi:hypothetical protein